MRDRGLEFLRVPKAYYDSLPERVGENRRLHDIADLPAFTADRDDGSYLLQIFLLLPHSRSPRPCSSKSFNGAAPVASFSKTTQACLGRPEIEQASEIWDWSDWVTGLLNSNL
jgi:hypothetical protein